MIKQNNISVDCIIVPGLAFENGKWGTLMKRRVIWAWRLYENGHCKKIIFSGGAVYTPYYEAYVMGQYAEKLGVPKTAILFDTTAEHSKENVYYSYLIAKQNQLKSIALATDLYQSGFLKHHIRRRYGTPIMLMPIVRDTVDKYEDLEPVIDTCLAKVDHVGTFKSIRERKPLKERRHGTSGKNIPWYIYPDKQLPEL